MIIGIDIGSTTTKAVAVQNGEVIKTVKTKAFDAITSANNTMVIGLVFIFAVLAIFALLVGDILMTVLDPRIKLSSKGGK